MDLFTPFKTALLLYHKLQSAQGIEVAVEFKPVEQPNAPLDNDRPIQCPLPEPSILNDGRIWKERVSATVRRRIEVIKEQGGSEDKAIA
ncbi:hypothetical protein UlMin_030958 [Ulmus minor]